MEQAELTHPQPPQGWLEIPEALPKVPTPPGHCCSPGPVLRIFPEVNVRAKKAEQEQAPLRERVTENLTWSLPLQAPELTQIYLKVCVGTELRQKPNPRVPWRILSLPSQAVSHRHPRTSPRLWVNSGHVQESGRDGDHSTE